MQITAERLFHRCDSVSRRSPKRPFDPSLKAVINIKHWQQLMFKSQWKIPVSLNWTWSPIQKTNTINYGTENTNFNKVICYIVKTYVGRHSMPN